MLRQKLSDLKKLLDRYPQIWKREVLNFYPQSLNDYPEEWVNALSNLSQEELWKIDSHIDYSPIEGTSLYDYILGIRKLIQVESNEDFKELSLPDWAYIKVKNKKKHELDRMVSAANNLATESLTNKFVAIGGGVGHLSRLLAHYYGHNCIDIDMDGELQLVGEKRLTKYPVPDGAGSVQFIQQKIDKNSNQKVVEETFTEDTITLGLHTCGSLAVRHIETAASNRVAGLINFGCCYLKTEDFDDFNISSYAQADPLDFTNHSLTLASRSHTEISLKEYKLKERVKSYRYIAHLYCCKRLGINEFLTFGDGKESLYREDFATYINDKLPKLGIEIADSAEEINDFYESEEIQSLFKKMYLMNIIRWQIGRAVEQYILCDRALYLEERGYQVSLRTFFDEKLSPRNIGITATRI